MIKNHTNSKALQTVPLLASLVIGGAIGNKTANVADCWQTIDNPRDLIELLSKEPHLSSDTPSGCEDNANQFLFTSLGVGIFGFNKLKLIFMGVNKSKLKEQEQILEYSMREVIQNNAESFNQKTLKESKEILEVINSIVINSSDLFAASQYQGLLYRDYEKSMEAIKLLKKGIRNNKSEQDFSLLLQALNELEKNIRQNNSR
ncbi:MAG: hypothetical protein HRT47_11895 [Candidatus Caenarcaniphilales bacterium]|nr:hypothetical protein [Candidatus Caenarcaniphilales bacterium]